MQVRVLSHTGFEAHPLVPLTWNSENFASALVNLRLDYAYSALYNTSWGNMLKLQWVQNSLVHIVKYTKRVEHIYNLLHQLHWLRSTLYQLHGDDTGQWEVPMPQPEREDILAKLGYAQKFSTLSMLRKALCHSYGSWSCKYCHITWIITWCDNTCIR